MRHGLRLDRDPRASWSDREARPYDTPLADGALPAAAADALRPLGLATIASSPFRRCLQTAGAVARGLGVAGVRVSSDLGELMVAVRRDAPACGRLDPLDDAAVAAALGDGVALAARGGDGPPWDEAPDDGARRFVAAVRALAAAHGRLLVVTHGDLVGAAAQAFAGRVAYDVPECGFLAFDASAGLDGAAAILAADRVLLLDGAASDGSDGSDGSAGSDGGDAG